MAYLRKHWITALIVLVASVMLLLPATAAARTFVGFGFGPAYYPYGYWGPYPYWGPYYRAYYGPYYGPYYGGYYGGYSGYPGSRPLGEVKIKSAEPDAEIYINGSLAGRAHDLKHFHLRQGSYDIEQRIDGDVQKERIYVIAHRTVTIEFGHAGEGHSATPPPPRDDKDYYYEREREYERQRDDY